MWRRDRRSGSATRSMATIFPRATVKPNTTRGSPAGGPDRADGAVDERRLRGPGPAREGARRPTAAPRTSGSRPGPHRCARRRAAPRPGRAARAAPRSRRPARRRGRRSTTSRWRARSASGRRAAPLHPPPGAAGQLPGRGRGAADDGRDLVERHGEQVVQHEGQPLGGASVSSTTSSARPTESASTRLVLGVGSGRRPADVRSSQRVVQRVLAPGRARAQHVQADAARRPWSATRRGSPPRWCRSG